MAQDLGLGGAGELGAAFGGAPRLRRAAYAQAQSDLASAFERAQAGRKDQSVAALNENRLEVLGSLADTFTRAGMPPDKAALAAAAVAAATTSNPNQIVGAGQQLQAQDAGLAGNVQRMNVINSARTGTPLKMTDIADGTAYNPSLGPDQAMNTTAVGQSTIGEHNAQAANAGASARRTNLLAPLEAVLDKARTGAAERSNPGGKNKPPSASDLRLAFSAPETDPNSPSYGLPVVDKQALGDYFASGEPFQSYVAEHFGSKPAAPAAAAPASAAGRSPYKDGTRLRGPGGKLYVVKGGVPVPVQ